jgi:hypothetical protein
MPPAEAGRLEFGAISSGVERHVDIVEVAGSKPASPTKSCFAALLQSNKTPDSFEKIEVLPVVYSTPGI